MEGGEGKKKKKMSLSYNVVGEGLKLIDISSEDDFLIASPLFDSLEDLRLSVTWENSKEKESLKVSGNGSYGSTSAAEKLCDREQNMAASSVEAGRPSYLRRSLAWDKAFFTNAGVLDPDELSFINQDVRARRPECSSESDGFPASKEVGISSGNNMIKSALVSKRDPINMHNRSDKAKTKLPKPAKVSVQSKTASMGTNHAKMQDSKTTKTGKAVLVPKKSAFGRSCSSSVSSAPSVSSTKSKLSAASVSTSKTPLRCSLESRNPIPNDSQDGTPRGCEVSSLQSPRFVFQGTKGIIVSTPRGSELSEGGASSGNSKPSCLRLPSPKIGFFDEVVPKARALMKFQIGKTSLDEWKSAGKASIKFHQTSKTPTGTGKQKQVSTPLPRSASAASFRLKNSIEIDHEIHCKSRKVGAGEHQKTKLSKESNSKDQREFRRKKRIGESSDLSRRFELIDLLEDLKIDCKETPEKNEEAAKSSPLRARTPLKDKTGNVTLETKKERLVGKAPVFHKENI